MSEIRKLPASAGAEWLLAGFGLLRRAPLALASMGISWGLLVSVVMSLAVLAPMLGTALQFLVLLAGPIFMGGLLWAVREVDEGRIARPSHLLEGLREGRAPHLLMALVPQLLAILALGALLLAMIGTDGLQALATVSARLNEISQSGAPADQGELEQLAAMLPAGRFLLWLLLVVGLFAALMLALFVMPPLVMFDRASGAAALHASMRASWRNLPAMLVFFLLALIAALAVTFAVVIVSMLVGMATNEMVAAWLSQLLLLGVLMPVFAGAVYAAWKQMFRHDAAPVRVAPANIIEA